MRRARPAVGAWLRRSGPAGARGARPALPAWRGGLALGALWTALLGLGIPAGCGEDAPRRGGVGESCLKTDDCEAPLRCLGGICAAEPSGSGAREARRPRRPPRRARAAPATRGPGGGSGEGGNENTGACDGCLDAARAAQEEGCGEPCRAIEGCIQTFCKHLSEIGAFEEEGQCQVKCQGEHPGAKQAHLDLVECANGSSCQPPCAFFPQDYEACRASVLSGRCADERAACEECLPCKNFGDCVGFCEKAAGCFACDDDASGQGGGGAEGGGAAFETCAECTGPEGAQAGACKAEHDACMANDGCAQIYACSYEPPGCESTAEGACCTIDCYAQGDAEAVDLFGALDACIYCETCSALCAPNAAAYCAALASPACS